MSYSNAIDAIKEGDLTALKQALANIPQQELSQTEFDNPLLHNELYRRRFLPEHQLDTTTILEALLDAGVDPNTAYCTWKGSRNNATALALALMNEDVPAIRLLLEHGADPDVFFQPRQLTSEWEGKRWVEPGLIRDAFGHDARVLIDTHCPPPAPDSDALEGRWVLVCQQWAESDWADNAPYGDGEVVLREDGTLTITFVTAFTETIDGQWERAPCERPVVDEAWPYDPSTMPEYDRLYPRHQTIETLSRLDEMWWPYGTLRYTRGSNNQPDRLSLEAFDEEHGGIAYAFMRAEIAHPRPLRR